MKRDVEFTFRPIGNDYPGVRTEHMGPSEVKQRSRFKAYYGDTEDLLRREISHLATGRRVIAVIQLDLREADIRLDGLPRANARPESDAVVLSFESRHGPLRYATDLFFGDSKCPGWQHNLRAIALSLEALRKVDRYGVSRRGEQYKGWAQLPSGIAAPAVRMTVEEAAQFIAEEGGGGREYYRLVLEDREVMARWYRIAAQYLHPDHGGNSAQFQRLVAARAVVEAEA